MGKGESAVIAHMTRNGGVIDRATAVALGMSPRTIDRRLETGMFTKIAYGVYALPGVYLHEKALLAAATSALSGVVSHHSAARLYGVSGLNPKVVSLSVPVRCTHVFEGVVVHQLTDLTAEHVMDWDDLPMTSPARTLVDLAAELGERRLADVVDQMVRWKRTSYESTAEMLESLARSGKPGVRRLRAVLKPRLGGTFVVESTLETRLLQLVLDAGLPPPDTQYRPAWLQHVNGRVDFAYRQHALVIEGDSLKHHGSPDMFQKDRERDNRAQLAGWRILRFTWMDITERPEYVVQTIRDALGDSSRS